jgi:hypothetical protein
MTDRWKTERRYGGKLVENRTQAISGQLAMYATAAGLSEFDAYMGADVAALSPSSAPRWDYCPRSPAVNDAYLHAMLIDGLMRPVSYAAVTRHMRPEGAPPRPLLHFVRFRDDRYLTAVKVFGRPDFIHRHWDHRAVAEVMPGDTVVFAEGDEHSDVTAFSYDDSAFF